MANTEKLITIQRVMEALEATVDAQLDEDLTPGALNRLQSIELRLNRMHRTLVLSVTDTRIAALKRESGRLKAQVTAMKKSVKELKGVAEKIDKAAKAVELLVKILETGAKLAAL